jgi:hypothetical protein
MFRTCGHSLELAQIQGGSASVKVSNSDLGLGNTLRRD